MQHAAAAVVAAEPASVDFLLGLLNALQGAECLPLADPLFRMRVLGDVTSLVQQWGGAVPSARPTSAPSSAERKCALALARLGCTGQCVWARAGTVMTSLCLSACGLCVSAVCTTAYRAPQQLPVASSRRSSGGSAEDRSNYFVADLQRGSLDSPNGPQAAKGATGHPPAAYDYCESVNTESATSVETDGLGTWGLLRFPTLGCRCVSEAFDALGGVVLGRVRWRGRDGPRQP